jgi:hypothetical protein
LQLELPRIAFANLNTHTEESVVGFPLPFLHQLAEDVHTSSIFLFVRETPNDIVKHIDNFERGGDYAGENKGP